MKPRSVLLACVICAACAPKPETQPQGAVTTPYSPIAVRNDSTLRAIVALEDTLRRDSTSAETPRRLYQLGYMISRNYLDLSRGMPDTAFKIGRDSMYWYNEIGGGYLYQGNHFKEVERRFPKDTLAVLAAWQIAFLPQGGECEGYIPCYMHRLYAPLEAFLSRYPGSRLAMTAVDSINGWWSVVMAEADSAKGHAEMVDSAETRKMLARYDSAATTLPDSLRIKAYEFLMPVLEKWGHGKRANEMRAWIGGSRGR